MKSYLAKTIFHVLLTTWAACCLFFVTTAEAALPIGEGVFLLDEPSGSTPSQMAACYYRPDSWKDGRPVVLVFHGIKRNAQEYCQGWKQYADEHNFLIICPEFSNEKYPDLRYYNFGNVLDREDADGRIQPQAEWIFPAIDHLIRAAKEKTEGKNSRVILYAHSAGAQLIHRYVLLGGSSEADLIISANAGFYTMPDTSAAFPYGLAGIPKETYDLKAAFEKPVVILLGENDTVRSKVLRKTPEADAQGQNRLERGTNFFLTCEASASALNTDFRWSLITVPDVGHDGSGMAQGAVPLIEALAR